ncbi:MAG: glutamine synthetase family protein, partial [Pseudomonadota bacterium]
MAASARIAAVDLNGQLRGKRVPSDKLGKPARMPFSALNVDIFGCDIDDSPLVFDSGDADGVMTPTDRDPVPLPWLDHAPDLQLCALTHEDGTPFDGDARVALTRILDRYAARGWSPQTAVELEFYLVEADGALAAPINPRTGRRLARHEVLSLTQIDAFEAFFNDIETGAAAMGLQPCTVSGESGLGQFEIALDHAPALKAADDALLMKELIKGTARNHGLSATFMAKPFAEEAGSGLHLHASILDAEGTNIFDDGGSKGTDLLRHAIAGCLAALPASTLILAPHQGSYGRFVPGAHAPTSACWGYDNRTVALRVPGGPPAARRFEHRSAGGDTNPYLLSAAILGAALIGIEDAMDPGPITTGNAYDAATAPTLAPTWAAAIDALDDPLIARIFPAALIDNLIRTKRQERAKCAKLGEHE